MYFRENRSFQEKKRDMQYCLDGHVHGERVRVWIELSMLLYSWYHVVIWIMMHIVGLVLNPDGPTTHLDGGVVHLIQGMYEQRIVYAWGCYILTHLYYDLGPFIFWEIDSMVHCTLLQVWCLKHITFTRPIKYPCTIVVGYHERSTILYGGYGSMVIYTFGGWDSTD